MSQEQRLNHWLLTLHIQTNVRDYQFMKLKIRLKIDLD